MKMGTTLAWLLLLMVVELLIKEDYDTINNSYY